MPSIDGSRWTPAPKADAASRTNDEARIPTSGMWSRLPGMWLAGSGFFVVLRLSGFVDVGAVFNAVDVQSVRFDIEGEEHPIVTSSCRA